MTEASAYVEAVESSTKLVSVLRTLRGVTEAQAREIGNWTMGHYLFLINERMEASDFDTWVSGHDDAIKADYERMLNGSHEREADFRGRSIELALEVARLRGIIKDARSYYGVNETAYAVRVLDTVDTHELEEQQ